MKNKILLLIAIMAYGPAAMAEKWYVDGGLGFVTFDDGVDRISPTNFYIRGGYKVNRYFDIGIEASVSILTDTIPGYPSINFEVNTGTTYIRAGIPVNDQLWVYGQLGSSYSELVAGVSQIKASVEGNDLMMGFGAEMDFSDGSKYITLNYSIYNNNNGIDLSALNLGAGLRF